MSRDHGPWPRRSISLEPSAMSHGAGGVTRRDFLAASALVPAAFWPQSDSERFLATVPLGNPGGAPTAPLHRLLGNGLDARLFTDLSAIDPRDPKTLITPNDRYYIRTASPGDVAGAARFRRTDLAALERDAVRVGPYVMECAGNADPANFGLLSAAAWEGVPVPALLDRLPKPAPNARVLVTGVDDSGPSRTSVPGASWIFSRDQ